MVELKYTAFEDSSICIADVIDFKNLLMIGIPLQLESVVSFADDFEAIGCFFKSLTYSAASAVDSLLLVGANDIVAVA